jgi:hypothetical protein
VKDDVVRGVDDRNDLRGVDNVDQATEHASGADAAGESDDHGRRLPLRRIGARGYCRDVGGGCWSGRTDV